MDRSEGVKQAVELLLQSRANLKAELADVEAALHALGVAVPGEVRAETSAPPPLSDSGREPHPIVVPSGEKVSVRASVQDLLEARSRWWTNADVAEALRVQGAQGDRTDEKFKSNVRTSLWSLRKKGLVIVDDSGRNIAAKFMPPTSTNATPVSPEVALGPVPTTTQEGDTNGIEPDLVRDQHSLWQARDQDRNLGASVVEVPS